MLLLQLNTDNSLYIQCNDLLTYDTPYYYFVFVNQQTKDENLIQRSNTTSNNPRIDIFTLDLPNDLDLEEGVYTWRVYESEQDGETSLPNDANELSNGVARVASEFTPNEDYEPATGTDRTYNG